MASSSDMIAEFQQRFSALARDLGPANTEVLVKSTTPLELPAGRKIIRDRMPVDSLYLVLNGTVSITVEESGRAVQLGSVGPGEWLGEVSVLSGELLASSTVTSSSPVRLLRLRHEKFEQIISTNYAIASVLLRQLVGMLADRLRASVRSFGAITTTAADDPNGPQAAFDPTRTEGRNWISSFFRKASGT
jgi:CRP-like cAMP-binding protein